jgi:hypothetical protein
MAVSKSMAKRFGAAWKQRTGNLQSTLARKKEQQSQIDRSKSKMALAELCDVYLKTVQHQKPKTIERKTLVVQRIKNGWPTGSQTQVIKIGQPILASG